METSSSLSNYENLFQRNILLENTHKLDQERIVSLLSELNILKDQYLLLKRDKFGKKSEKWESKEQMLLFNEAEVEASRDDEEPLDSENGPSRKVKGHTRKSGGRKALPEGLPREEVVIELPPEERVSDEGLPLIEIGAEYSEKLKYEPAKLSVILYKRIKYGVDSGDYVKTAPPVPAIIPKGIATPELLAAIVVGKYADGLPLYRMEDMFGRHDIDLHRSTMGRWVIEVAKSCQPIWNVLSDDFLSRIYGACDETSFQVLKESGRRAETKSWMIVRSTPSGPRKIALFDYSISRSKDTMKDLFCGFQGYLQSDGLNSYEDLNVDNKITLLGCNMHGRRYFEQALYVGAKNGEGLAEIGLKFYQDLYKIEEDIREMSADERFRVRNELARPIWKSFVDWVMEQTPKVPLKSKIGKALNYFIERHEKLMGYLSDGILEMDNGHTERVIRKFAIGRNNWMFADTEAGAKGSAILYSLVITAKLNGINPYKALVHLFAEIPKCKTIDDYERLAEVILSPKALP